MDDDWDDDETQQVVEEYFEDESQVVVPAPQQEEPSSAEEQQDGYEAPSEEPDLASSGAVDAVESTSNDADKSMTADAIAHALGNVERLEEVVHERGSLSNVLAGTAAELEWHMKEDQVAHAFESRPSEEQLEHVGIQKTKRSSMSDVLASTAVELEKHMKEDQVAHALESRPSEHQLEEAGIIKGKRSSNLSNALVGTAVQLERNITIDKVAHALEHRPSEKDLEAHGLMKGKRGSLSDVLASTAVQLEKEMKGDVVSAALHKRASDLSNFKSTGPVSNVLAASSKELEKHMLVDQVAAGLSRRASQQELLAKGVLKRPPSESKIIAAPAVALEKALSTERVGERIARSINTYVQVTASSVAGSKADADMPSSAPSLKDRMQAYMTAAKESSGSPKTPAVGPGIRERMRQYKEAAATKNIQKSEDPAAIESKLSESPRFESIKDRAQNFQQQDSVVKSSSSPRSPVVDGPSLKERLAAYQETAASAKKAVEIDATIAEDDKFE